MNIQHLLMIASIIKIDANSNFECVIIVKDCLREFFIFFLFLLHKLSQTDRTNIV